MKVKKRGIYWELCLLVILINLVSLVNAETVTVKITFDASNAPLGYTSTKDGCYNTPIFIDDVVAGQTIKISNIQGAVCDCVKGASASNCINDITKGCGNGGCLVGKLACTSSKIKIGFYGSTNNLISEYGLDKVQKGVQAPANAVKMYVYHKDSGNYHNNNAGLKCSFDYVKTIPCTDTCLSKGYDCGTATICGVPNVNCETTPPCSSLAGKKCQNNKCVDISIPAPECTDDQAILKLYNWNNSHASLASYTDYYYNICYNQIFGIDYTGNIGHSCIGNNKIMRLSSVFNAHAEIPEGTTTANDAVYNKDVCFGDLECRSILSGECDSIANEKIVARLSSTYNAHVGKANSDYLIKICCKQETAGTAYWTNMIDETITSADLKDSVKLVLSKQGIAGKTITFEVYNKTNNMKLGSSIIQMAQSDSKAYAVWKANYAGNIYFKAIVSGGSGAVKSNDLSVSNDEIDSFPEIHIIKPAPETNYTMDKNTNLTGDIGFEVITYDEDDDLNITWYFGDGNSKSFSNCLTGTNCNTAHKYSQKSGVKMVSVVAREMTRNGNAKDVSRIFIYKEGLNIYAIIDSPDYKEPVRDGGYYDISGVSSHVANCSFNQAQCNNTGGGNCYPISDDFRIESDSFRTIYCYKYAQSNQLVFNWIIDGNLAGPTDLTIFKHLFIGNQEHVINLKVKYTIPD